MVREGRPVKVNVHNDETVCERLGRVNDTGAEGLIIHFRFGAMPYGVAPHRFKLFAKKVAPNFRGPVAT